MNNKYETWTDADLKSEWELIMEVLNARKKKATVKKARELCINGITAKDISVEYGFDDNEVNFSFFIKHDAKKYNIYYESGTYDNNHNFTLHPWWPIVGEEGEDGHERNGAFQFIPRGFCESCENSYEFKGTFNEAFARLKECGITDITKGDW